MAKKRRFEVDWEEIEKEEQKLEEPIKGGYYNDPRFYKVKLDADGRFLATIRFLPPAKGEGVARVPYISHFFKRNGVYSELCPKTIGKKCPVCEKTYEVYTEYGKELAKKKNDDMYQKNYWISNILILEDSQHPENEGKVFLWKYGKTVHDIIDDAKDPKDPDDEKITKPFSFYEGANFRINAYEKKYIQYDRCKFRKVSELYDGDDDKIEAVYKSIYPLSEFNAESHFPKYEELETKLNRVLGLGDESNDETDDTNESNSEFDSLVEKVEEHDHADEDSDDGFFNDDKKTSENNDSKQSEESQPKKEDTDKVDLNEVDNETDFFNAIRNED